jgi:hypothetical protein
VPLSRHFSRKYWRCGGARLSTTIKVNLVKDLGDKKPINKGWEVKIGVSEVSYNTIKNFSDKKEDKESEIKYRIASREDNLENVKINKDVDLKKAVIIINGKVSSVEILIN